MSENATQSFESLFSALFSIQITSCIREAINQPWAPQVSFPTFWSRDTDIQSPCAAEERLSNNVGLASRANELEMKEATVE